MHNYIEKSPTTSSKLLTSNNPFLDLLKVLNTYQTYWRGEKRRKTKRKPKIYLAFILFSIYFPIIKLLRFQRFQRGRKRVLIVKLLHWHPLEFQRFFFFFFFVGAFLYVLKYTFKGLSEPWIRLYCLFKPTSGSGELFWLIFIDKIHRVWLWARRT